jgi:hypothetical protein
MRWRLGAELALPSAADLKSTVVEGSIKPEGALHRPAGRRQRRRRAINR